MALKKVTLTEVISLFEAGYTRLEKDNVDKIGSIEDYYGLTAQEKIQLFNHPKIKGYRRKVITPVTMEIVDDLDSMVIEDDIISTNTSNEVSNNSVNQFCTEDSNILQEDDYPNATLSTVTEEVLS